MSFSPSNLWGMILDLLLPQRPLVRELLAMEPVEFVERAKRPELQASAHIISLFDYHDKLVREAVWMLKYRGNKQVAALLGQLLYEEILAFLEEYGTLKHFGDPLIIPVPLSSERLRTRGFNQCELLTSVLARLDSGFSSPPFPRRGLRGGVETGRNFSISKTALAKIKDTQSQTKAESKQARLKNLRDCFSVAEPAFILDRNIMLIDDVVTTGATLHEARKTLLDAGARKVIAFTIAH
ncbi:MAG: hypothetical protein Q7R88_01805 [bacterium]|nr:hypothetical protein [bacterium]